MTNPITFEFINSTIGTTLSLWCFEKRSIAWKSVSWVRTGKKGSHRNSFANQAICVVHQSSSKKNAHNGHFSTNICPTSLREGYSHTIYSLRCSIQIYKKNTGTRLLIATKYLRFCNLRILFQTWEEVRITVFWFMLHFAKFLGIKNVIDRVVKIRCQPIVIIVPSLPKEATWSVFDKKSEEHIVHSAPTNWWTTGESQD